MDPLRVFTQRSTFNYVLVIEWLRPRDTRTGAMLAEHLRRSNVSCAYANCATADVFRTTLREALVRIPELGIPAIHIETHGQEPPADLEEDVAFGSGIGESLTWSELGELLAPLNQAADFQLMLVGAACFGAAAQGAMNAASHVAPFSLCIGYQTSVEDASVLASMTELYTALFVKRENPHQAIASAQAKLLAGESIHYLGSVPLAYGVVRWCVADLIKNAEIIPPALRDNYKQRFFEVWEMWFPRELQERDETYRLDWSIVTAPEPSKEAQPAALAAVGVPSDSQRQRLIAEMLALK
jgi:hypothetical protein